MDQFDGATGPLEGLLPHLAGRAATDQLKALVGVLNLGGASLWRTDSSDHVVQMVFGHPLDPAKFAVPLGRGIAGTCAVTRTMTVWPDEATPELQPFNDGVFERWGWTGAVALPIEGLRGEGVLTLYVSDDRSVRNVTKHYAVLAYVGGALLNRSTREGEIDEIRSRVNHQLETISAGVATTEFVHDLDHAFRDLADPTEALVAGVEGGSRRDALLAASHDVTSALQLLRSIINGLRDANQQRSRQPQDVDLSEVLRSLEPLLTKRAAREARRLDLTIINHRQPLVVSAPPGVLQRVVLNLFVNALYWTKFAQGRGEIKISLERVHRPSGTARLIVHDNGIGAREEAEPNLTTQFFSDRGGMGIGLHFVETIAAELGGRVKISTRHGEFFEVTVELPLKDEEETH